MLLLLLLLKPILSMLFQMRLVLCIRRLLVLPSWTTVAMVSQWITIAAGHSAKLVGGGDDCGSSGVLI